MASTAAALALFLAAIPRVVGFLAVLIIDWIVAGILAGVVGKVRRSIRFNELAERSGLSGLVRQMGWRPTSPVSSPQPFAGLFA
jgi:hypothetical protein